MITIIVVQTKNTTVVEFDYAVDGVLLNTPKYVGIWGFILT